MGPFVPQSDMPTTRPLRPELMMMMVKSIGKAPQAATAAEAALYVTERTYSL